jgi:hypothetical protein
MNEALQHITVQHITALNRLLAISETDAEQEFILARLRAMLQIWDDDKSLDEDRD